MYFLLLFRVRRQELPLRTFDGRRRVGHQRHDAIGVRVRRSEVFGRLAHVRPQDEVERHSRRPRRSTQRRHSWLTQGPNQLPVCCHRR